MPRETKDTAIFTAYEDFEPWDRSLPERNLLRAILLNALYDLKRDGLSARRAMQYFLSPDEDYIFSFKSICNFLEIDEARILRLVAATHRLKENKPHLRIASSSAVRS